MIELHNVFKSYISGGITQPVLNGINLRIPRGEFVAIVGPSGNGKSTLMNLLTGIDQPSAGEIVIDKTPLHRLSGEKLTVWRCANVGIVFQFFQLLPTLSLWQNVVLPMDFLARHPKNQRKERALDLLNEVGLAKEAHRLPSQVSGGQQQRAAIARALANDPPLIVADEPTGNLDEATAEAVFQLFGRLHDRGKTLVMVTHNESLANAAGRKITLHGGRIDADSRQA